MPEPAQQNMPSTARLLLGLFGYVLLFAAPAAVLSLVFPEYAIWIVLTAIVSILAVAGFCVGLSWDSPDATDEARAGMRQLLFGIGHMYPPPEEYSHGRGWVWYVNCVAILVAVAVICSLLWGKSVGEEINGYLVPAVAMCGLVLPTFFLGRAVKRWENRQSRSLK